MIAIALLVPSLFAFMLFGLPALEDRWFPPSPEQTSPEQTSADCCVSPGTLQ